MLHTHMQSNENKGDSLKRPLIEKTIETELALADRMAIERTKLSNERTFLSYLRTSLTLLGAGLTIIRLDLLEKLIDLGVVCLAMSPLVLAFAIYRFIYNRNRFNKYFDQVRNI
ncbi:DUF202 domain-containing protein [Ravibacter arvi]